MTKELTQEVEEIVKEFEQKLESEVAEGGFFWSNGNLNPDRMKRWLRQQLTSLAEKAEERGRVHGNERYNEGYKHGGEDGAQEMQERAIACVPREWESSVGNYNDGFSAAVSQILSALTHLN